jgi:hypothetical protein
MAKIKFRKDNKIRKDKEFKEKYPDYKDYIVPKKKNNRVLCIILRENKHALFEWVHLKRTKFSVYGHTYFMFPEAVHVTSNNILLATYMEGISLPISGSNIERRTEKRKYIDADGIEKTMEVSVIKGLKFDSKVADIVLSRNLIDVLANVRPDKWLFFTFIMLIAITVISVIGIIATYVFR